MDAQFGYHEIENEFIEVTNWALAAKSLQPGNQVIQGAFTFTLTNGQWIDTKHGVWIQIDTSGNAFVCPIYTACGA